MSRIDLHQRADELEHARIADGRFHRRPSLCDASEDARVIAHAVARAKDGDREAVRYLYVRYADNVYSYVATIVHDPHEAEDVTQHVFVKLMSTVETYDARVGPFAPWVLRIAHNVAIDHLRQMRAVPRDDVRQSRADTANDDHRQRSLFLREVLASLPDDQRAVVVLRHVVGLSPGEIADRLGKTESSVHGLHHRGREAMRDLLRQMNSAPATRAHAA